MAETETGTAVAWIENLPSNSRFRAGAVPGRPAVTRTVLHRLVKDESFELRRVARGLYWRGWPAGHIGNEVGPDVEISGLIYAGPGAGLAHCSALSRPGWTTQMDPRHTISVAARRLQPPHWSVRYVISGNRRREHLNWSEVSVLEALAVQCYAEEPWQDCTHMLASGCSARRFKWPLVIYPAKITWASDEEPANGAEMHRLISDLTDAEERQRHHMAHEHQLTMPPHAN